MNKVLVTGGAGFLGSHLVDELVKRGYKTFVVDNLSSGSLNNLNSKSELIKLDINDSKIRQLTINIKPNYIFHFAAQTSVSESIENPKNDFKTNLISAVPLLEAAIEIKIIKFFFSSSAAVYGEAKQIPISEDFPKKPTSPYGIAKLSTEFLINMYSKSHGLPYLIFRYSNIYGPRQDSSAEGGVVSIFASRILKGQPVTIFGDGKQTRDFIYVSDVINANLLLLGKNITGTFNVATQTSTSINDLFEKISKSISLKAQKQYAPPKYLEVKNSSLSFEKIKKETGWSPETSTDDGLKTTINFFKGHEA